MNKKWVPVEDGFTREEVTFQGRHTERVSVTQDWLTVAWRPETGDEYKASAQLPSDLRLCRLTDEPTLPPDVAATMREALEYHKAQTEKFVATVGRYGLASSEHANRIAAIDAALAWLNAQSPTP